jgi:hypothetical protein
VVNMFAPQRAIVRADDVVVLDDFLLVVWLQRGSALPARDILSFSVPPPPFYRRENRSQSATRNARVIHSGALGRFDSYD